MSNNIKAFTKVIAARGSGQGENHHVNQSSPTWVLTFVRWQYRDTLRTPTDNPDQVRPPMVIENDCVSVSTNMNKGTLTPSMNATLKLTDVNYETEIAPGDFVFVNMLNWQRDSRRVADQARANKPINGVNDGFKGFYKVQSVRRSLSTDAKSGEKTVTFNITGFAFTEFNNTVYFNPNLVNQKDLENQALFIADVGVFWRARVTAAGKPPIQDTIAYLIQAFIGSGVSTKAAKVSGMTVTPNAHFLVPTLVGRLLGVVDGNPGNQNDNQHKYKTTQAAKDIYLYLFGIQHYASGSATTNLSTGMNPSNLKPQMEFPGFYYTAQLCGGISLLKPEFWNQVKLWSILNQYTNTPLNELYTCFRVAPHVNRIMPTVVFRQIPFTNSDFMTQPLSPGAAINAQAKANNIFVTTFLTLPRWKVTADVILDLDIGREEAARINFVQYYSKSNFNDKGVEISGETAAKNYMFDASDIERNGLRPYIAQVQFDDDINISVQNGPIWARIVGDALTGGQLKMNGTMVCKGITEPITVGDNLEFDGTVYHIEQVSHTSAINPGDGVKQFRTTISLSSGINIQGSTKGMTYSEMTYSDAYKLRQQDWKYNQVLPGVSESQDIKGRPKNLDLPHSGGAKFPQPFTQAQNKNKKNEDND
jgi:hypothetical protein